MSSIKTCGCMFDRFGISRPCAAHRRERQQPQMDWQQVVLNSGPPCFFVEGPQFCGRAERWQGHGNRAFHDYVSLDDLLATTRKEARVAAFRDAIRAVKTRRQKWTDEGAPSDRIIGADYCREAIEAAANTEEATIE